MKGPITKDNTLQIAMYWLMGLHSVHAGMFRRIKRIGIFNPRLGVIYMVDVDAIPRDLLHFIEVKVIGYSEQQALFA